MKNKEEHWNKIFSSTNDSDLGWYEDDVSQTLKFLDKLNLSAASTVFLPGAGTSRLVDELENTSAHLVLNDISLQALESMAKRNSYSNVELLHHDMGLPLDKSFEIDLWLDRAVLHFLLDETAIHTYFENLNKSVNLGGYVFLAEFSDKGAKNCAGLEIHQYTLDEMILRLGTDFELVESEEYVFVNPFDQERPYVYALFKRVSG